MDMTKANVKAALGIQSDAELARLFPNSSTGKPITRWAVGQWADNDPIPPARQWELRAKFPRLFKKAAPEARDAVSPTQENRNAA